MKKLLLLILLCTLGWSLTELEEQNRLAPKYSAQTEVKQWDDSRIDMIFELDSIKYACEIDWAYKWKEAVGQALYYSILTGYEPAILLLIKDWSAEEKHIYRCQTVCAKHRIKLILEEASKEE